MSGASEHPGDRLSAYLDGELEPEAAASVGDHVASCPLCREELDRLDDARRLLRGMAPLEPPPGFTERFGARLRRVFRRVAGGVALAGAAIGAALYAAAPARAVRPPIEEVGSVMPALPAGTALSEVPAGYFAPETLDGMPLVGLRRVGSMVGALYGSAPRGLLVLEEPGQLVVDTSYPAARTTSLAGYQGVSYVRAGEEAFTWQDGAAVVTLVGDPEDLAAAARSMAMRPRSPSLVGRARGLARDLVEDLTGSP
jgi:anti-sigma factor RsiW